MPRSITPFARHGARLAELTARKEKVFLDLKYHDIPNTVAGAVREAARLGVGTYAPHDPTTADIADLVGSVDLSKVAEYGDEGDPRAWSWSGAVFAASRGLLEMIEILKVKREFLYLLLTLTQEKNVKVSRFPLIHLDETILAHTNLAEFRKFLQEAENEALLDRIVFRPIADASVLLLLYELVAEDMLRANTDLPEGVRVRRFVLLHKQLDPDDDEITRTRKVRRNVIDQRYGDIIAALNRGDAEVTISSTVTYQDGSSVERKIPLRVFDLFPMTHHVECVAILEPAAKGS